MQSILLVGENPALQLSRAAVLSRLGVAVDVCGGADAVARIGEKRYAVVVLCHSFFGLGEDEMIQKARETSPETVVFKVIPEHWWKRDLPQDAAAACPQGGPDAELLLARGTPRQQKDGHIRAPDQQ